MKKTSIILIIILVILLAFFVFNSFIYNQKQADVPVDYVEPNFSGEADPARMKLDMTTWRWQKAVYSNGQELIPKKANQFTLIFTNEGRFTATTDCNSMAGSYTATKDTLAFGPIASTEMFCEGSQEMEFAALLEKTGSYHFTGKGELILEFKGDSGTAIFR